MSLVYWLKPMGCYGHCVTLNRMEVYYHAMDMTNPGQTRQQINIAAVTRKPDSASYQQRVLGYLPILKEMGIHVTPITLPKGYIRQYHLLSQLKQYDAVWWHRHLITFPHLGRLRKMAKALVFDFDDPVFYSSKNSGCNSQSRQYRFTKLLKQCDATLPASRYLQALADPFCDRSKLMPMAIDLPMNVNPKRQETDTIELLWLGSSSTQIYLERIRPVMEILSQKHPSIKLRLVAHNQMTFGNLPVDFRSWSESEQDRALRECHIGLCPMPDTRWTRGKSPFKVIQYMAHGMPWVGDGVGENVTSAGDPKVSQTGLCATSTEQWLDAILALASDPQRRTTMGHAGIEYVKKHHDRQQLAKDLAEFWHQLVK